MGLATPTALMAAANCESRQGILIRDAVALEKAGQLTSIVFDKTGTLTQVAPTMVERVFSSETQKPLRVIHQNLFWAFLYNAAAVPLASLGFMHPLLCAITMGLSDLIVVGNSLRLLRSPLKRTSQRRTA